MNFNFEFIKNRIINLITKPKDEWVKIKDEKTTVNSLFLNYGIFLAVIPAIAGFIGFSIIGFSVGIASFRIPIFRSLIWMIFQYVFTLGSAFIMALIIDALAPNFGSKKDLTASMKIAVYSASVSWVFGIFFLIPRLSIVWALAGLYALFVMYMGLKEIKAPGKDKEVAYFVVVIIVSAIVTWLAYYFARLIAFGGAFARIY